MRASRVIVENHGQGYGSPTVRNIEFDPGSLNSIYRAVMVLTGSAKRNLLAIELDDLGSVLNVDAFQNGARSPLPPNSIGNKWYRVTASVDDLDSKESGTYSLVGELPDPPDSPSPWIRIGGRVGRVLRDELVEVQDVMDAVRWWAEHGAIHPHMNWRPI